MLVRLLAIDLGLRSGLAAFAADGTLVRYRSTNFGSRGRLRSAAWGVLSDYESLAEIVLEGDRNLAALWEKAAQKQRVAVTEVAPETWREDLFDPSEMRNAHDAKESAIALSRRYIDFCDLPSPTSLRHDAAEAICIGLWRAHQLRWDRAVTFLEGA